MFVRQKAFMAIMCLLYSVSINVLAKTDEREKAWQTYESMKTTMQTTLNNQNPSGVANFFHAHKEYSSEYAKIKEEFQWWKASADQAGLTDQIVEIEGLLEKMDTLQERFNYLNIHQDDLKQPLGLFADLQSHENQLISTFKDDIELLQGVLKDENHLLTDNTRLAIENVIADFQLKIKALENPPTEQPQEQTTEDE